MNARFVSGCSAGRPFCRAAVLAAMAMALTPLMVRAQVPTVFEVVDNFTKDKATLSVGYGNVDRIDLDYGPEGTSAPSSINFSAAGFDYSGAANSPSGPADLHVLIVELGDRCTEP